MNYVLGPNEGIIMKDEFSYVMGGLELEEGNVLLTTQNLVFFQLDDDDDENVVATIPLRDLNVHQGVPQVLVSNGIEGPQVEFFFKDSTISIVFYAFRTKTQNEICEKWSEAVKALDPNGFDGIQTLPIRFCCYCGKELPEGANFCLQCGSRIRR
jgi:hypothetical protein